MFNIPNKEDTNKVQEREYCATNDFNPCEESIECSFT